MRTADINTHERPASLSESSFSPPALQRTSRRRLQTRLFFLSVGRTNEKRSQLRFEFDKLRYTFRSNAVFAADLAEQYAGVGAHFLGHVRAVAFEKVRERVDGAAGGRHG
jgi:hypothetical protein